MVAPLRLLDVYLHLAAACEERYRPDQTERFLVLAAASAMQAGRADIATSCWERLTALVPHHPLLTLGGPEQAFLQPAAEAILEPLRRMYPWDKAQYLLTRFEGLGYSGQHGYGRLVPAEVAEREKSRRTVPAEPSPPPPPRASRRQPPPAPSYYQDDSLLEPEDGEAVMPGPTPRPRPSALPPASISVAAAPKIELPPPLAPPVPQLPTVSAPAPTIVVTAPSSTLSVWSGLFIFVLGTMYGVGLATFFWFAFR